ncbi:hypothetical protein [Amphiplicatus metriothermophilus]|uniref:Uncharacterized protein n=1 Tax=Amphiplicatus metriothermophilus TaxID=1519374 RepID=A0A239PNS1_9PROT|nr:hypothetical protein [Amphiplicatus metriothermophilus]MBB5518902.1 hypothetical protein [Amphiplicatus metriothermophilus]SNT71945.1 hypothetical protein SAMN06297382_0967 [Amphiplicatus metriothermophilus]
MELTRRLLTGMLAAVLAAAPALACCLQAGAAHAHAAGPATPVHAASHAAPAASHCDEAPEETGGKAADNSPDAGPEKRCPDCDECESASFKKDMAAAKASQKIDGPALATLPVTAAYAAAPRAGARPGLPPPATAPPRPTPVSLKDILRR